MGRGRRCIDGVPGGVDGKEELQPANKHEELSQPARAHLAQPIHSGESLFRSSPRKRLAVESRQ